MSFSSDVKKELIQTISGSECCNSALFSGMLSFGGRFSADDSYTLVSESYKLLDFLSVLCAEKFFILPTLIKRKGTYSLILPEASMILSELDILRGGEI